MATSNGSSRKATSFVTYYLVLYNTLSTIGWGYILVSTFIHVFDLDGSAITPPKTASTITNFLKSLGLISGSVETHLPTWMQPVYLRSTSTFARVGAQTALIQTFALLEVVHALLGWVRSPLQTTAMQVASRLFLVWGVIEQFEHVRSCEAAEFTRTSVLLSGSHESFVHFDGTFLVNDRSHPLRLLRLQPLRIRTLRPSILSILHLLYPIPCGRILRGLPHLCHPSQNITHPRLASLGSRNVETDRLLPCPDVLHLVACVVCIIYVHGHTKTQSLTQPQVERC